MYERLYDVRLPQSSKSTVLAENKKTFGATLRLKIILKNIDFSLWGKSQNFYDLHVALFCGIQNILVEISDRSGTQDEIWEYTEKWV